VNLAEYCTHDATSLAGLVKAGEVSAVELAQLAATAVAKLDPS